MKTFTQLFMIAILNCMFIGSSGLFAQYDGTNLTNTFFDSRRDYPMGSYIESTTSADFNNDGFVDFACGAQIWEGTQNIYQIKIFINNGDGTYKNPVAVNCVSRIRDIATGDFDNDGWVDLVILTNNRQDLEIIMNQGDEIFVWERRYAFYGAGTPNVIVMDKNNDGFDDILSMYSTDLNIYLSNGDGTFAVGDAYSDFNFIQIPLDIYGSLVPWDVNHDDYPDILIYGTKIIYTDSVNYYFQPIIATYVNNGDTTLQPGVETLCGNSNDGFFGFDLGNFNSDLEKDILRIDQFGKTSIFTNNGDGSFSENIIFVRDYDFKQSIASGDVNGDGYSDIIFANPPEARVSVMLNNGNDEISFADSVAYAGKYSVSPTYLIQSLSIDLNNDSYDDIILAGWELSTIFSHGDGTFPVDNTIEGMGIGAFDMLADDFNGDGAADIMTIAQNGSYFYLHVKYNDGNGSFSGYQNKQILLTEPKGIYSGDFNADGISDCGVIGFDGLQLFYGLEAGGFQGTGNLKNSVGIVGGWGGIAADFNDDGYTDFANYWSGNYGLNVVLSDSSGEYHNVDYYTMTGNISTGIASADIDGDNDLDIVVCGYDNSDFGGPGFISIRYNDGNGQFSTFQPYTTELSANGVVVADFNDDGYSDIAATQFVPFGGYISVYLNNQDGTFPTHVNYAELYAAGYRDIVAADMDNDGNTDLLTYSGHDEIVILPNAGDGTFPEVHYYSGGDNTKAFAIAHLDSGSTMDVAVTSSAEQRHIIYLFLNTGLNLPTDLAEKDNLVPNPFLLEQNYPNPFNPTTTIKYSVTEVSKVSLILFNLLGQEIITLVNDEKPAGNYSVNFNAVNLSSGVYFYRLQAGSFVETRKMILLK